MLQKIKSGKGSLPGYFRFLKFFQRPEDMAALDTEGLHSELLSSEQMDIYACTLAKKHRISKHRRSDRLLSRLADNEQALGECREIFLAASGSGSRPHIGVAGEWLLDNYWLVEEQISAIKKNMPRRYIEELPQLDSGPCTGLPRVYDIVFEHISHNDGHLDIGVFHRFLMAYQSITPLRLGELWAIPLLLRLALIENLRRVSTRIIAAWQDQRLAAQWADIIVAAAGRDGKGLLAVAEMVASKPPLSSAFVAELARCMQGQGANYIPSITWIEELLSPLGLDADGLIQQDTRRQAADQVSISNTLNALRIISAQNWREFVESASLVERTLRDDPAGIYQNMDFATRDHYRHTVEQLARRYRISELELAENALRLARNNSLSGELSAHGLKDGARDVNAHVGYYLIDEGQSSLRQELGADGAKGRSGTSADLKRPRYFVFYLGFTLAVTGLFVWPFFYVLKQNHWSEAGMVLAIIPVLLVTSQLGVRLANWLASGLVPPDFMPRMDYHEGIPPEMRALVVIPAILDRKSDIEKLTERLEVHFLANRDKNIQFGLLTDFKDAPRENMQQDFSLLELAGKAIDRLNAKYPSRNADRFFLCHRPRVYNQAENIWMGWERKRGKLSEFNRLLLGMEKPEHFLLIRGNTLKPVQELSVDEEVHPVRFVITLDADTQLPRDAARRMAGAMAHPLNRPVFNQGGCVVSGYALMQPRVGTTLVSAMQTGYASLLSHDPGIDPYTNAVSDIYQDLFNQGSYVGKGIYDVEAFEKAVNNRFPDNSILSHDLIEGCFARSGLIADLLLFEDAPGSYAADAARRHRWIRGDWQLLPWLMPFIPARGGRWVKNPLSPLSLWKLGDNLRRSLVAPALLTAFAVGWFGTGQPLFWTLALLSLVFALPVFDFLLGLFHKPADIPLLRHLEAAFNHLGLQLVRSFFTLVWLPNEAVLTMDAVLRTLWRLLVSRKHLLQWSPFADTERNSPKTLMGNLRNMWGGLLAAVLCMAGLYANEQAWGAALPIIMLWLAAPLFAWKLSSPRLEREFSPSPEDKNFLHRVSRRTWAFFEHYVNEENNWLPPDNVQERPELAVAQRTSPTNIGLSMLAHLAAYDFCYLSADRLLNRLEKTAASMFRMQRWRGHFYNWYDTSTLEPLLPQYVSTVDSGNLAGHLLTLRQGLLELADKPVYKRQYLNGICDTLQVLGETLLESGKAGKSWQTLKSALASQLDHTPATLAEAGANLRLIWNLAGKFAADCTWRNSETDFWLKLLLAQCEDMCLFVESMAFPHSEASDDSFPKMPSLNELAGLNIESLPEAVRIQAQSAKQRAVSLIERAELLAASLTELSNMDFAFLYDRERGLLSIGYSMQESRLDKSYYDLLASEARLAYYVGITHNQLPQESWFQLGRMMNAQGRHPVLMSWSGSMFEYLMPELVMPGFPGTILNETCLNAVRRQIAYGMRRGLPWGVSESAYNMRDAAYNYQYRAFGVPGLGLRRGLGNDYVAAPYASLLALMFLPAEACINLNDLASRGVCGRFGFYEAVDYTPLRLPRGSDSAVIYSFMAHHQAMGFLGLTSLILGKPMQRRFMAVPEFKAGALLLEEKMPRLAPDHLKNISYLSISSAESSLSPAGTSLRVFSCSDGELPAVQLLSNGNYHVMLNSWGGGYSRYRKTALTRWREDPVCDGSGMFIYIRDLQTGEYWSATRQPTMADADSCQAVFSPARAEFKVSKNSLDAHTEIVVSPEDHAELRRLHIRNRSRVRRSIELTSYAEVVLSEPMADAQHPAFNKLFVETEIVPELQAIICSRRPRSRNEDSLRMFQMVRLHECEAADVSYETDRARFIGRGRTPGQPAAMEQYGPLSGSQGAVLDPVAAIRCNITLNPGEVCTVDFVAGVGDGREGCIRLIEKFRACHLADRVFDLAWTHSQVQLHQFNAGAGEVELYEKMAASIIYPDMGSRAERAVIEANELDQSKLWSHSISGDLPIVLLRVSNASNIELLSRVIKAHAYWRMKGLMVDLIILNEDDYSYRQSLHEMIISLINSSSLPNILDTPGGIFVRAAQALSREERILIQAAARMVLSDSCGSLEDQVSWRRAEPALPEAFSASTDAVSYDFEKLQSFREDLQFANLYGGFGKEGREYVIRLGKNASTPAPWVNVLANEDFGCIVSERGSSYTWKENAHEFRITPWFNDPVCDPSGEALYIRDEESGIFWSPTPAPTRGEGEYLIRHGFGYSVFEHISQEIESRLCLYVARNEPVKFFLLRLRNRSHRMRRLSVTGYVEWALGDMRSRHALHIVTAEDRATGAIFARNPYIIDFPGRVAFFDVDVPNRSITGDRLEFLGRNRSLENPAAMQRVWLSGRVGGGFDPCGAIHTGLELDGGEERELVFILGGADNAEQAQRLIHKFSDVRRAKNQLEQVKGWWEEVLGSIQIRTPDKSSDIMANGWLMYQVLASRFFARSGFYQSGGAFGYRDQLQDCMAMVYAAPELVRSHLLHCAAHQFPEGDVMHWWHPPTDRGVRTRCSDDYLWLPAAVERYVRITGDFEILSETAGYVEGRPLNQDEESYYDLPSVSGLKETLYQHCVRAIRRSMARGGHGLPLIGSGDWNDGMNLVGIGGKGESVWLGFFCCHTLRRFAGLAAGQGDAEFAELCLKQAGALRDSIEEYAWDGAWYRRAYFDDGTPLGSAQNAECRIDSISQSWSVLCGSTAEWRQKKAMHSLEEHLVDHDAGIIRLLYPSFDKSELEPGYIKGYLPGVRENGGQYTHAAVWAVMACAALGQGQKAWELLDMLNPINHTGSEAEVDIYKVEPYVLSADVYAEPPHVGRGGWSWLTGAASWMYRLIIESLLGLHREGARIRLQPLIPEHWEEAEIVYTYQETVYQIKIFQKPRYDEEKNRPAQMHLYLDGVEQSSPSFLLVNDGMRHEVELYLHRAEAEEMQLGVD